VLLQLGRRLFGAASSEPDPAGLAAPAPKVLWVELTSRCPFDCIFCSRKTLRGKGEDLDLELYRALLRSAGRPDLVRLNYSGESTHYPHLAEAVALAKEAGAMTELVSALASATSATVRALVQSGLDALTISLHALDPEVWRRVYRFSSPEALRARVAELAEAKAALGRSTPRLTFAFVAMFDNLGELAPVGEYARQVGAGCVFIHPVLRRDEIPARFERELAQGRPTEAFLKTLGSAVNEARRRVPQIPFVVSSPVLDEPAPLGPTPHYYPGPLPPGARIATCDQNPWETVHVLANGDVVGCEVRDRAPLGNLREEPLDRIWRGPAYSELRRRYVQGGLAECRTCPWKMAHLPAPLRSSVRTSDGACRELWRGWYEVEPGVRWSRAESVAVLANPGVARALVVQGLLPEGRSGRGALRIFCNGRPLGELREASFQRAFDLGRERAPVLTVAFEATSPVCRAREGTGVDERELGFALISLEVQA
jgi:radical SAM protein with 4Fe4S-binding SPASM domain